MSRRASAWMPFHVADYLRDTMHLSAEEHGAYLLLIMACWTRGGHLPNDEIFLAKTARISLTFWRKKVGPVVLPFFKAEGAEIIHKRVVFEVEKAQRVSETRAEAGRKGGRPAKANGLQTETHAGASLPLPTPLPSEGLEESPSDPPLETGPHDFGQDDLLACMFGDPGPDPDDRGTGPMLTAIPKAKRHKGLNGHAVDFERWYAAYPKHVDRGAAEKAYLKAITLATPDQLVTGAEAYAAHIAARPPDERRFTKNPATWLNAKGWLDERPVCELTTGGHDGRPEQLGPAAQRRLDNVRRGLAAPGVLAARRTSG